MGIRHPLSLLALFAISAAELAALQRPSPPSCEQYQAAVAAEPNNLDAAVRLGQCTVRDEQVIVLGGDSTRVKFRTNWAPALRALRHTVAVDPTYTRAYRPLFRMLLSEMRDGCSYESGYCLHVAPVLRDADSVFTPPRLVISNDSVDTYRDVRTEWQDRSRANVEEARDIARRWASVAPNDRQPHEYLGRSLLQLGDYDAAAEELERAATLGTDARRRALFWWRMEALVKANRGVDARRVLDETVNDPGRDTSQLRAYTVATLNALLGRDRPAPVDSNAARRFRARIDSMTRNQPIPPPPPPPRQPTIEDLIASGDTAAARRLLAQMTSQWNMRPQVHIRRFYPHEPQLVRYHLMLRDTAGAEGLLNEIEQPFEAAMFQFSAAVAYQGPPWVGRAWLLRGDVAAARGRQSEAAAMYRRVIGLWAGADADVQPVVNDARVRLEALRRR
jgi:tetratricopeptide (TPR) repeat protein